MNALPVHAIRMQHAPTRREHTHVFATPDTLVMAQTVKTSMNAVCPRPATQMLLALILRGHLLVHAIMDLLEMELIAKMSMNAILAHVILMQHAPILWDPTHAFVTTVTLAMGHSVKISMNATDHPATRMQPAPTMLGHMGAHANLVILEMELIVMVSILID